MKKESNKKDFFISYSDTDLAWAEWVAWRLEENGYTTMLQAWDFRPGSNLVLEMQQACLDTNFTIVILSSSFLASGYTSTEWALAFAQDPNGLNRKLIPVRVEECQPNGLLRAVVCIDLVGRDEDDAVMELLIGVRKGRRKPRHVPHYPTLRRPPVFPGIQNNHEEGTEHISALTMIEHEPDLQLEPYIELTLDKLAGDKFLRYHLKDIIDEIGQSKLFIFTCITPFFLTNVVGCSSHGDFEDFLVERGSLICYNKN